MAELEEDFLRQLKSLRGEFGNSTAGRIGNRVLAHVFSTVFPICFLGYLVFSTDLGWPLENEQWLFLAFALLTLFVGIVIHRSINSRFIFDDEGIKECWPNGALKRQVRWNELERVDFHESRGIKMFIFKTENATMSVEFYKSISEAMGAAEKLI